MSGRINVRHFIGRPEYLREVRQRPEPEAPLKRQKILGGLPVSNGAELSVAVT